MIDSIKEKQIAAEQNAFNKVKYIINANKEYEVFEYSLLWSVFRRIMNDRYQMKTEKSRVYLDFPVYHSKSEYFIYMGNIPDSVLLSIKEKSIPPVRVRITKRVISIYFKDEIIFSRSFGKTKNILNISKMDNDKTNCERIINQNCFDLMRFNEFLNKIFRIKKPKFALLSEDRTKYNRMLVNVCRHHAVPSFVIQHGIIPKSNYKSIPMLKASFAPLNADYFISWGDIGKEFMLKCDTDEKRIITGGSPYFKIKNVNTSFAYDKLLIIDQQFLGLKDERDFAYKSLINGLKDKNIPFSIYLRGSYNYNYLKNNFKNIDLIKWRKNGVYEEIDKHSVILTFYSTAIIDALSRCRNVIIYDYAESGDIFGLKDKAFYCTDIEEIADSFKYAKERRIKESEAAGFLKEHIESFGIQSAEKISTIILDRL